MLVKKGSWVLCTVRAVSRHSRGEKNSPNNYSTSLIILSRWDTIEKSWETVKTTRRRWRKGERREHGKSYVAYICVCVYMCVCVRKRRAAYVCVQTRGRDRRCEIAKKDRRRKEREWTREGRRTGETNKGSERECATIVTALSTCHRPRLKRQQHPKY